MVKTVITKMIIPSKVATVNRVAMVKARDTPRTDMASKVTVTMTNSREPFSGLVCAYTNSEAVTITTLNKVVMHRTASTTTTVVVVMKMITMAISTMVSQL